MKKISEMGIPDGSRNSLERRSGWAGYWTQLEEVSSGLSRVDILIYSLILAFGAFHLFNCAPAKDGDDVFYVEAGRSLVEHGFYGINGQAETNLPPGVSLVFGLLSIAGLSSRVAFLRGLAIFATLGFVASYELLRRQIPRGIAAAICLLLISSRVYFLAISQSIYSFGPYLLASVGALSATIELEKAAHFRSRMLWGTLSAALIAISLMFNSAAIALLGAVVVTICIAFFKDRRLALRRVKTYLAVLVVGAAVQGIWTHRVGVDASAGISASEWPVPGFPQSYLSQLKVKSGNYPELGMATAHDVAVRVFNNTAAHANFLSRVLLRRLPQLGWTSVFIALPFFLIALGWSYRVKSNGGDLLDWYFAGYEFIYLFWPWGVEDRFLLPVAPLACLYLWCGGVALIALARDRPRALGVAVLPVAILFGICTWFWVHGSALASHFDNTGLEYEISFILWSVLAILAGWMIWANTDWFRPLAAFSRLLARPICTLRVSSPHISRFFPAAVVAGLIVTGLFMQVEIGRANLDPTSPTNRLTPDAEAAKWIRLHTDPNVVVMARHVPICFHYSDRKVVWFPPSSNPQLLMDGIHKHKVNLVIVVRREYNYYLPSDEDCFAALYKVYRNSFELVHQAQDYRIFRVATDNMLIPHCSLFDVRSTVWR